MHIMKIEAKLLVTLKVTKRIQTTFGHLTINLSL